MKVSRNAQQADCPETADGDRNTAVEKISWFRLRRTITIESKRA
ncbi:MULTISPECIES: hypothetical protein [unclassified Paenibacillus]